MCQLAFASVYHTFECLLFVATQPMPALIAHRRVCKLIS
ncbi:hypothetical protein ALQ64_102371 [Pseudomonas cannabina]|uniref:Uncharacterized protein n=1 Tax=Pseudomonas cannabina TaxID=86840 RepID=A0A0P9KHI6_PSECA|nr:Unknown protein sequence [Pseudomonas syringae pv. maculicola]KPW64592.1 hypothetical protein ALO81_102148 [Pseudomonas cannabina]RMN22565.1 hypothetical protein ALQ64_102371 [Pseudomonas cannabina]